MHNQTYKETLLALNTVYDTQIQVSRNSGYGKKVHRQVVWKGDSNAEGRGMGGILRIHVVETDS